MAAKWFHLNPEIDELAKSDSNRTNIASSLISKHGLDVSVESLRKYVASYLSDKTDHTGLKEECEAVGIPVKDVGHYWYKGQHYSIHAKNKGKSYFDIRDDIIEDMKAYAPSYKEFTYDKKKEGHLYVVDPADIHIGKLCSAFETGEDYDCQIAVQRVKEGVQGLLNKAQGFHADKIQLIIGNDILHVDTPKRTTTSGTSQDTDGMWYDNFLIAKRLMVDVIETLMQIAPVQVDYNPSNHDYTNGFFLADTIASWFSRTENVTFNTSIAHRKYFRYYNNLIGSTHADGAREADLALLMAHEAAQDWANCKHRYIYAHHYHHKKAKDYMSVCVETLRSPSGTDSWHHRQGFQHAPKAVEAFIHDKEHGQIARITHIF